MKYEFTEEEMNEKIYTSSIKLLPDNIYDILSSNFFNYIKKIVESKIFNVHACWHSDTNVFLYNGLCIEFHDSYYTTSVSVWLCESLTPDFKYPYDENKIDIDCNKLMVLYFNDKYEYRKDKHSSKIVASSYEWFVDGNLKNIAMEELEDLFRYANLIIEENSNRKKRDETIRIRSEKRKNDSIAKNILKSRGCGWD